MTPLTEGGWSFLSIGLSRERQLLPRICGTGLPWWLRWQGICLKCGRPGFSPCVGKIAWRRNWQATPVFLPGESHGEKNLAGKSPQGWKELDMTGSHTHTHTPLWYKSKEWRWYETYGGLRRPCVVSWNAQDELLSWEAECFSAAFILMGSRKTKLF